MRRSTRIVAAISTVVFASFHYMALISQESRNLTPTKKYNCLAWCGAHSGARHPSPLAGQLSAILSPRECSPHHHFKPAQPRLVWHCCPYSTLSLAAKPPSP